MYQLLEFIKPSIDVQIAIISAVAVICAAAIPTILSKRSSNRVENKIGNPNGHGTLASMIEEVLSIVSDNTKRITRLEHIILERFMEDDERREQDETRPY